MAYRVKEQRRVNRNEHKFYFSSFAAEFVTLAALMAGAYSVGAAVGTARVKAD